MKITELKDWETLTPEEQTRLREVYQVGADDELPESFTLEMADSEEVETTDKPAPTIITPKGDTNVNITAENVEVHEAEK